MKEGGFGYWSFHTERLVEGRLGIRGRKDLGGTDVIKKPPREDGKGARCRRWKTYGGILLPTHENRRSGEAQKFERSEGKFSWYGAAIIVRV